MYDRVLIVLVLLAPLALVVLSKWQASLENWYVPPEIGYAHYLDDSFSADAQNWINTQDNDFPTLYFLFDRECPCTKATLGILRKSLKNSTNKKLRLVEIDASDLKNSGSAGAKVYAGIPSTPTLLATDDRRLIYAGPVTAGNFCTVGVQRILGLAVLENPQSNPVVNAIDKGCYCQINKTPADVSARTRNGG